MPLVLIPPYKKSIIAGLLADIAYATWDSPSAYGTLSNNNLTVATPMAGERGARTNYGKSTGKWYWEVKCNATTNGIYGFCSLAAYGTTSPYVHAEAFGVIQTNGLIFIKGNTAGSNTNRMWTVGDVMGFAVDFTAGNISVYRNNVLVYSTSGAGFTAGTVFYPYVCDEGGSVVTTATAHFGPNDLTYAPPSGYNIGFFVAKEYATFDATAYKGTLANNNLTVITAVAANRGAGGRTNFGVKTGKWYCELKYESIVSGAGSLFIGVCNKAAYDSSASANSVFVNYSGGMGYNSNNGYLYWGGQLKNVANPWATYTVGDMIGLAIDLDAKTISFYKNGTLQGSMTLTAEMIGVDLYVAVCDGGGAADSITCTANFGATAFTYSVPSGFNSGFARLV